MNVSVLVPSYRRPAELARCLDAIRAQQRAAGHVVVVVRSGDNATFEVVIAAQAYVPLEIIEESACGQVLALNAGLKHCTGDVVAITDDDAAPRPDWLLRIAEHFDADAKLGAVGGRDWVHQGGGLDDRNLPLVGRFLWFGRAVGNHHIGSGPAREVDFLKGANCAFRLAAIRPAGFDERLRGAGAQVHNDMVACLALKRAGWRVVYDPAIAVDHYPAPRFDRDRRGVFDAQATADQAFNFRLALASVSPPWRRLAAICWHNMVGTREAPGFARVLIMFAKRDHLALARYQAVKLALQGEK